MKFLSILIVLFAAFSLITGYPQNGKQEAQPEDQLAESTSNQYTKEEHNDDDDSDMYMEAMEEHTEQYQSNQPELKEGSQTFYPSFSPYQNPPLGHSRPFYYQPEAAYSHRPFAAYQQQVGYDNNPRFSGYKAENYDDAADSKGILGSGNFGVIRGGTFYDNDGPATGYSNNYNYYQNGHGRPSTNYNNNPRPQTYQQFENFRDFADINTPTNSEYSQFVVVYANKNETEHVTMKQPKTEPKNIIERLAMIDLESTSNSSTTTELVPTKKLSSSKRKLALHLPEKKQKRTDLLKSKLTTSRDLYEPLLALS